MILVLHLWMVWADFMILVTTDAEILMKIVKLLLLLLLFLKLLSSSLHEQKGLYLLYKRLSSSVFDEGLTSKAYSYSLILISMFHFLNNALKS